MNDVYFACRDCKLYIDAGYRWVVHQLRGIVSLGEPVAVDDVLAAEPYWHGIKDEQWSGRLMPQIHAFLVEHHNHDLIFAQEEDFRPLEIQGLDWMEIQVGYDLTNRECRSALAYSWGPRHFAEQLKFLHWEQVVDYMASIDFGNWWYDDPELRYEGRRKFEYYVKVRLAREH